MARNTRPMPASPSRASNKEDALASCTQSAGPAQLQEWLRRPPSDAVARIWRQSPWPLKRAVELDRRDLFCAWVSWGCSPQGAFHNGTSSRSLVDTLSHEGRVRLLQWSLEEFPSSFSGLMSQLRLSGATQVMRDLDWNRILASGQWSDREACRLSLEALLGAETVLPLEPCLRHSSGKVGSSYDIQSFIASQCASRPGMSYSMTSGVEEKLDRTLAERFSRLSPLIPLDFNPGHLAINGGFFSTSALVRHFASRPVPPSYPRLACRDYELMFCSWKTLPRLASGAIDQDALIGLINDVLPCVDWRKTDKKRRTALHAISMKTWPEAAMVHLLETLVEARPAALTQKDKEGHVPATSPAAIPFARDWFASYAKRRSMTQVLKHQVSQTEAVREATRPSDPPSVRRM